MHKVAAGEEKKRKEETTPVGVIVMSQVLYRAAQGLLTKRHASGFTFETQTGKHPGERQQKGAPTDKSLLIGSS